MRAALFHNIVTGPVDPFDRVLSRTTSDRFTQLVDQWTREYEIVGWREAMQRRLMPAGRTPMHITFDDGFAGVFDQAFPILAARGLVATVFVLTTDGAPIAPDHVLHFEGLELAFRHAAAGSLDVNWLGLGLLSLTAVGDRVQGLRQVKRALKQMPDRQRTAASERVIAELGVDLAALTAAHATESRFRKLSADQITKLLNAGWTIGGHTRSHPVLAAVDDDQLEYEIQGNAEDLVTAFGLKGIPFAYPFGGPGHVDARAQAAVQRAGFSCAFTTTTGQNDARTDVYRLHRYSVTELQLDGFRRS